VITLSAQPTIGRVDALFGGAPVSALLISILMLLTAQYAFMGLMIGLRKIGQHSTWIDEVFYAVNPVVILISVALFVNNLVTHSFTSEALASILITLRNMAMAVWVVAVFMPRIVYLWRVEKNRATRINRALNIAFLCLFFINCVSGAAASLGILGVLPVTTLAFQIHTATQFASAALSIAMLLPFRWLLPLMMPRQIALLIRLMQLDRYLHYRTYPTKETVFRRMNIFRLDDIELAVYQRTIAVLDKYRLVDESAKATSAAIGCAVDRYPSFDELAQRLAMLRRQKH
jgi:hypothetical protein